MRKDSFKSLYDCIFTVISRQLNVLRDQCRIPRSGVSKNIRTRIPTLPQELLFEVRVTNVSPFTAFETPRMIWGSDSCGGTGVLMCDGNVFLSLNLTLLS
ncbi:hypothetical protein CEXT_426691 [Caerostris extrusa]|uniref:Uncharacterized protein n=1 Tax=Caerostris extrusa TaxID=172846 RepID=A0AAV4XYZ6_CAEEX|nr:hypothetical protein CEXT_426691 [Caerostris extrusa]